jgi:hypothetical protein
MPVAARQYSFQNDVFNIRGAGRGKGIRQDSVKHNLSYFILKYQKMGFVEMFEKTLTLMGVSPPPFGSPQMR